MRRGVSGRRLHPSVRPTANGFSGSRPSVRHCSSLSGTCWARPSASPAAGPRRAMNSPRTLLRTLLITALVLPSIGLAGDREDWVVIRRGGGPEAQRPAPSAAGPEGPARPPGIAPEDCGVPPGGDFQRRRQREGAPALTPGLRQGGGVLELPSVAVPGVAFLDVVLPGWGPPGITLAESPAETTATRDAPPLKRAILDPGAMPATDCRSCSSLGAAPLQWLGGSRPPLPVPPTP